MQRRALPQLCAVFAKLRERWGVSAGRLVLILCTFAIGGSLCGRVAGLILDQFGIGSWWIYAVLYLLLVTLLWPVSVMLVSIPLGQFVFFKTYLARVWRRIRAPRQV